MRCVCGTIIDFLATPCLQVAGVSWLEKKAAAALFGSPPESSYEEALESLMKVLSLLLSLPIIFLYYIYRQKNGHLRIGKRMLSTLQRFHTHAHTLWLLTWNIQMTLI